MPSTEPDAAKRDGVGIATRAVRIWLKVLPVAGYAASRANRETTARVGGYLIDNPSLFGAG
jgi:hypothetical protein